MGKQWNGGMGPQTVISRLDIEKKARQDKQELLNEFRGGIEFGCCKCGENYKIGEDASVEDVRELQAWLSEGNCPYCKEGTMAYYARLKKANMLHAHIPHNFKIEKAEETIEFFCIRLGR